MNKRKRRTLNEIRKIRELLHVAVEDAGTITLSQLVGKHGSRIGVKNTPSDKNLVKKQLDQLAKEGKIEFVKIGRDLVAKKLEESNGAGGIPEGPLDLAVIRAYAVQVEEFAKTLQGQIRTLVRMVEKATN